MPISPTPIIWSCWFQGEQDENMPYVNKCCLDAWKRLNPNYQLIVIDNNNVDQFVPEYNEVITRLIHDRTYTSKSDLLRLLLLKKYGGVWADASLLPMLPLDLFLPYLLKNNSFFSYRFFPRFAPDDDSGDRETVSWFLAVQSADHFLINQWLQRFLDYFLYSVPFPFFSIHQAFVDIYDSQPAIRRFVQEMPQLSERIPHCLTLNPLTQVTDQETARTLSHSHLDALLASHGRQRFFYSFMYKRPMNIECLQQISQCWADDFSAQQPVSSTYSLPTHILGSFPLKQMIHPLIGCNQEKVLQACFQGLCFFDSHRPDRLINILD
jgi:hypothetical protein